jgi:heptosyltransferase-2
MAKARILVIRGGAIGDFILTLPALTALRRQFPGTQIEVLGYPKTVALALQAGLADRVQHIEARPLAGFFARHGELSSDWRNYFSDFNIIISYLYDPDEIFRLNVARCSSAQFIQGPHRPVEAEKIHATKVFLKPLERLAIYDAEFVPELRIPAAAARNSTTVAFHPGSGSESKNWPESKWKKLLGDLAIRTNLEFLLIGGEAEGSRLERLASGLDAARLRIAQNLPLADLAVQLQACAGFVGHDSGITHLAAALGLPCLALWAHTEQSVWQPLGRHVTILQESAGLHALAVPRVLDELLRMLERA